MDSPLEPQLIVGDTESPPPGHDVVREEPKRFSADDGRIFANNSPHPHSEPVDHIPTHGPLQHVQQQPPVQNLITIASGMPFLLVIFLGVSLVWLYFKQRTQQKEWQLSSANQLEIIRQRNSHPAEHREQSVSETVNSASINKKLGKDVGDKSKGTVESDAKQVICSIENADGNKKADSIQCIRDNNASKPKRLDHVLEIRAKQQEKLERSVKSTRQQQKKKRQAIHSSFDHDAADEAYERRRNLIIAEEKALLQQKQHQAQQQSQLQLQQEQDRAQQQALRELEEMERMAILQQQDVEYQEALIRDQERAQKQTLENEIKSRREVAIEQAKQRLVAAGVQNNSGITHDESAKGAIGNEDTIKVRLLLPSGRRVEGTFSAHHVMGLVYDLALLILDSEHLLWNQEYISQDIQQKHGVEDSRHETIGSAGVDSCGYNDARTGWKQIFYSFSLVITFPPQSFDNLNMALGECGIGSSAMLMVVVESD